MGLRNTPFKSTTNTYDAEQTENNILNPGLKRAMIQENLLVLEE